MKQRTPLYQHHLDAGASMVDFAGWAMPLHYGSQLQEHRRVREAAGVFDVSHMAVVDVEGDNARDYMRHLLANDVAKLDSESPQRGESHALYSAMLNHEGGVIDDLIVYRMAFGYRLVVNCATADKDLKWMAEQSAGYDVQITRRPELGILAVHGPESIPTVCSVLKDMFSEKEADTVAALSNFRGTMLPQAPPTAQGGSDYPEESFFVARTGYTGEKGLEVILPGAAAPDLWERLLTAGVQPVGLGARDSLRLEAGMNLYGQEMDETVSPVEANMARTIAWEPQERDFIGRAPVAAHLQEQKAGKRPFLTGLVLEGRGVLRRGQRAVTDRGEGRITSGGFSPTLRHSIALATIPSGSGSCEVELRGEMTPVRIVPPNFVRFGKKVFE